MFRLQLLAIELLANEGTFTAYEEEFYFLGKRGLTSARIPRSLREAAGV